MPRGFQQHPDRLLPLHEVQNLLGGRSRSSIYRDIEAGRIPAPVRIGRRIYWRESDIRRLLAALPQS